MMEVLIAVAVLLIAYLAFEYRVRKPDQVVVSETRSGIKIRSGRFYPRHFSFPIARTTHSFLTSVDATAKGNLDVRVKLAVTVAASMDHLPVLLRAGGWKTDTLSRAAKELDILLQGEVKEFTEQRPIENLSSDAIRQALMQQISTVPKSHGLDVVTLAIQSFEPANPQISEALRQQEHARILEQTEALNQKARVVAARSRLKADEEIARLENDVELRKYDLKKEQLEKESALADQRVADDLRRSRKRLELDREELELLKASPELLMLTPQAARLAEASQGLKNARTVVSISPGDLPQGSDIIGLFQRLLQSALNGSKDRKAAKEK